MTAIAPHPVRERDPRHRARVRGLRCTICGQPGPNDPHHLKYAQPRAMSLKTSDAFIVPLCRAHHHAVEHAGDEKAWWAHMGIDPLPLARALWTFRPDLSPAPSRPDPSRRSRNG